MQLKIGVMGSSGGDLGADVLAKAYQLGTAIAQGDCVLITGACPGLPHAAVQGAKAAGGLVVGISPGLSLDEHVHKYNGETEGYDVIIYTGSGLMGREITTIRTCDMVAVVGGRTGTLGEFAIAYDEGRLVGVLCDKQTGARVLYESAPGRLVERLLDVYRTTHHRKPSCFYDETAG
jgi:uncharacterized protein (TIGR00725 family)